jgi:bacterioferritin (cytochrome b1)
LEDNGRYEFHAEMVDEEGLNEILSDEDEEEIEEI